MPEGSYDVFFGAWCILLAFFARRAFRDPEPESSPDHLHRWMMRHIWRLALVLGVVFVVIGIVRFIV